MSNEELTNRLREALYDPKLSWRAKGLFFAGIMNQGRETLTRDWLVSNGAEGRDAVITALKELRRLGYVTQESRRCMATGKLLGNYLIFSVNPNSKGN